MPILAYPAFAEQKGNARQLEDFRAARLLEVGFENLPEATRGGRGGMGGWVGLGRGEGGGGSRWGVGGFLWVWGM